MKLENKIKELLEEKSIVISIDGPSASGKSTLAEELKLKFDARVIHMDDYFLPPIKRTKERLNEVGGNVDYERFKEEVINNLESDVLVKPFSCKLMDFVQTQKVPFKRLTIIEGSYSLHPYFDKYYDLSVFLKIDPKLQHDRIKLRNPNNYLDFYNKWIPMENKYIKEFEIEKKADMVIEVSNDN